MMPRSLSQTGPEKRRFTWPKGTPQIIALLLVLLVDSLVAPHFYQVVLQDGRLFGSPIDILNRAAPVALLAIGMTLVIATCRWCCWPRWPRARWPDCGTASSWRSLRSSPLWRR